MGFRLLNFAEKLKLIYRFIEEQKYEIRISSPC
jgi:hypothetical protein